MVICSKDASWEADIIIIAADYAEEQESIAIKINEVTTCKTVIQIKHAYSDIAGLQAILPYSKFISVNWANTTAIVEGNDEVSLSTAGEIVHLCGLKPIFKKSLI
jgi:8-hydroxy-5-deazaflavin:NADPH oxidoreductase